jgi:bifunctional enzyme CysN/CysC
LTERSQPVANAGAPEARNLLRFLTCGSVDDGKSTLIGRLLTDTCSVYDDQLEALKADSLRYGTTEEEVDFALLLDGLQTEREQAITIDVAYRFFSTDRRAFIVADTPGHEQYTRNMATGASTSDLAVILVDARKGVLPQTRRHSMICSLLGIRHLVLAINKIDLIGYREHVFNGIVEDYLAFAERLKFRSIVPIPLSARFGDNLIARSGNTAWYRGPALLEHLEAIDIDSDLWSRPLRFMVGWVNRPNRDFRGVTGRIASGRVRVGDEVVASSGAAGSIARIVTADGDLQEACAGSIVTLVLAEDVDIGRGDLISHRQARPETTDQIAAHVLWMNQQPLLPGRSYLMRIGNRWTTATVSAIKHRLSLDHHEPAAARVLKINDIGFCNLATVGAVSFDPYEVNRNTGAFILVDRQSCETLAAGMISFGLRRAANIHPEQLAITKAARARTKHQRPCILWLTGLSGAGKSTIARLVEARLHDGDYHTYMLDGDNLRGGLSHDLGFTQADRVENIRRAAEVAKLFVDAGLIVLCAFISPFRAERQMVRDLVAAGEFIEIFIDTPLEECMRRDPKGLYKKAQVGAIVNFTGFDSPYEAPENPELVLRTIQHSAEQLADHIVAYLRRHQYLQ